VPSGITRRRLLASGILYVGGFALYACAEEPGSTIVDQLVPLPAAATVGRAYLASNPVENDAGYLAGLLSLDRSWALIEEEIREDYRDGRIARVSGWPLSITEARIFALASLRRGPAGY